MKDPIKILEHARWHCLYGSGQYVREPDLGDWLAVQILERCIFTVAQGRCG